VLAANFSARSLYFLWKKETLMKARHFLSLSVAALLLFPASILAQGALQPTRGSLPDLVVADLSLNADCKIVIAIRNNGPAAVPDAAYALPDGSSVQIYRGGSPLGGTSLGSFDLAPHESQPAGGVATYTWFHPLANGDHVIRVDVDSHNSVSESIEINNSMTRTLTCRKGPDLQPVSISLVPTSFVVGSPCRIVVTLRNNGPDSIPESAYTASPSVAVQMLKGGAPWGGHSLITIDSSRELKPAGATKTAAWYSSPGHQVAAGVPHVIQLVVDGHNSLVESNEANNSLTQTLTCGPAAPTTNQP
jgi:hypothetical protein